MIGGTAGGLGFFGSDLGLGALFFLVSALCSVSLSLTLAFYVSWFFLGAYSLSLSLSYFLLYLSPPL